MNFWDIGRSRMYFGSLKSKLSNKNLKMQWQKLDITNVITSVNICYVLYLMSLWNFLRFSSFIIREYIY